MRLLLFLFLMITLLYLFGVIPYLLESQSHVIFVLVKLLQYRSNYLVEQKLQLHVSFPCLVTLTHTTITTALTGRTVMSAASPRFHHYFRLRTQKCGSPTLVEATFAMQKISLQKTQFDHVVASLLPEIAVDIRNLILHPPVNTSFSLTSEVEHLPTQVSQLQGAIQTLHKPNHTFRRPTSNIPVLTLVSQPNLSKSEFCTSGFAQSI